MKFTATFVAAAVALLQAVAATNLYVSSYDGNVTSLSLSGSGGNFTLSVTGRDQSCVSSPSWLNWDKDNRVLYCIDEGNATPNGSITSYSADKTGKLNKAQRLNLTAPAPVNGVIFGDANFKGMAIAHYTGQVATLAMSNATSFKITQQLNYTGITPPGPNPAGRQATPHEHQTIVDPTGQFILVPDLGADLVRVFCWAPLTDNNTLAEHPSLKVAPGSGPRHATFWSADGKKNSTDNLYMFVVTELANTVTAYKVSYPKEGGMNFTEVYSTNSFGGAPIPLGAAAAELVVSPDNKFLMVSNRNDSSFSIDNYNPANKTLEYSDSIATFALNNNGSLAFKQLWPAGGLFPRQFSINAAGDMIAVGLQTSGRVVIISRDVKTGLLGQALANSPIGTAELGPTCIVWDE